MSASTSIEAARRGRDREAAHAPRRGGRAGLPLLLLGLALLPAAPLGCDSGKKSAAPAAKAAKEKAPAAEPDLASLAEEPETVLYVYSPLGKRDPFENVILQRGAVVPVDQRKGPLQSFDIDALRLRFTVTGTSAPIAMIIAPGDRGYVVRIGDFVGKNWGKVSHIGREEIIVTETIADPQTGRVYPVNIPMRMPKTTAEERAEQIMDMTVGGEDSLP